MKWSSEEVQPLAHNYDMLLTDSVVQVLGQHFTAVSACLDDPELPVRIQACMALTEMIIVHETGESITSHVIASSD